MSTRIGIALCALMLALCFTPSIARAEKLTKEDKELIKDAMRNLEMGAQCGRLARTNTKTESVKDFGEKLTVSHTDMIKELHEFANKHDFTFEGDPTKPDVQTDWAALARSGSTIVLYMSVKSLPRIAE